MTWLGEGRLWLSSKVISHVWRSEGPSVGDLGSMALYDEDFASRLFLMRETVLGSKLFIDCSSWKMGAYHLLRVDQRLNTFCRKECLGREAYWLSPLGL